MVAGEPHRPSYVGPPRRYYRITELGRQVLADWLATWSETRDFVDNMLKDLRT